MKITVPAAMTAIALGLAACAHPDGLAGVGQPLTLPDGHSSEWLISGGVCADPQCWTEDRVTAGVHTYYRGGRLVSDVHDMRPVTAPAAGYALAQMALPAAIQGGATVGAGVIVSRGIMQAGAWQGEGAAASGKYIGQGIANGDKAIGQGVASAKPPVINATNVNTNTVSAVSSSTSAASAAASAKASAAQSQGQSQLQGIRLDPPNDEP